MTRIPTADLLYGAALRRLVSSDRNLSLRVEGGGYLLNDAIGIWIKHTRRALPAQFTFTPDEMREMIRLRKQTSQFYIGLVCPSAGVCCVTWDQFDSLIAIGDDVAKTIMVRRPLGGRFRIKGSDKSRPVTVPMNKWGPELAVL
jgi:hypothetical protein